MSNGHEKVSMSVRDGRRAAATVAMACAFAAVVCLCVVGGQRRGASLLLSTEYWSRFYSDAPANPHMYTGYPSYAAMMPVRRPAFYNSDVDVEEAIGLPTATIDDLNFKTKEGKVRDIGWRASGWAPLVLTLLRVQEATAKMVDVIAGIAFQKKVDEVCRAVPVARRARVCVYCLIIMLLCGVILTTRWPG